MPETRVAAQPARRRPRLDLLAETPIPRWAVRLMRGRPWKVGALAFFVYYGVPLLAAALAGVLVDPDAVPEQFGPVGIITAGEWLARSPSLRSVASADRQPLYYAGDTIHLGMATVTMLLGASLTVAALRRFKVVFDQLVTSRQLTASLGTITAAATRARRRCRSVTAYVLFVIGGALMTAFMLSRTFDPNYQWWWGHQAHGPAGLLFSLASGLMVSGGASAVYLLYVGARTLSELFKYRVVVRPFHPDGCNGFAGLGNFIILLFFLSVAIAGSVSITFLGGYLNVEAFVGAWIVGAGVIAAIPVILILPLVRCTLQIGRAKHARMSRMEAVLNQALVDIEDDVHGDIHAGELDRRLDRLMQAKTTMAGLYGPNNFPFKPHIVGVLSLSYILQVVVLIREAASRFTGSVS
jgi:hypothetical protein